MTERRRRTIREEQKADWINRFPDPALKRSVRAHKITENGTEVLPEETLS